MCRTDGTTYFMKYRIKSGAGIGRKSFVNCATEILRFWHQTVVGHSCIMIWDFLISRLQWISRSISMIWSKWCRIWNGVIYHKEWQKTKKWKIQKNPQKCRKYAIWETERNKKCHFKWQRKTRQKIELKKALFFYSMKFNRMNS